MYVVPFYGYDTDSKLIRSPAFNRLAARTHARVQKLKTQWGATEEELQELREQERLLKEAEKKLKSVEPETETKGIYATSSDMAYYQSQVN
jgi:hypothetical protein